MWRQFGLLCALLGLIIPANASEPFRMTREVSIQARVQGDAPVYNPSVGRWLSMYGNTPEFAYRNSLDTVNMASVEGALMYVQAEGINVNEQSVKCERKNKMQYVVLYEITIVQPTSSLAYYANHIPPTYSEFVAMDGGKCTNEGSDIPLACKVYYGLDGTPNVGRSVGAGYRTGDRRAPYPDCLWFSFPNSCAQKYRTEKTDECRNQYPPGLCPLGVQPDGVACTFSYKILGFINIDDLVGITSMGYRNYYEFCSNGGVEFKAINTPNGFQVEQSIDFWKNPSDPAANARRSAQMIAMYNDMVLRGTKPNMIPLPSVEGLTASNPKCFQNSKRCAQAQFGCKRELLAQVCTVCMAAEPGCEKAPAGFVFPDLPPPK